MPATATPHGFAVLDDHRRRQRELAHDAARAFEVGEVVVRELLAAELLDAREQVPARARPRRSTRRAGAGSRRSARSATFWKLSVSCSREELGLAEPGARSRVVRGRRRERLGREHVARARARARRRRGARRAPSSYCSGRQTGTTCAKFFAAARSIDGPPTSIISIASASVTPRRAGDRRERVEVDADEVERLDPVLGERVQVLRQVAPGEDAGVDARVERLHAPAEHLRRRRHLLDASSPRGPCSSRYVGRAARRDELVAEVGEPARELVEPVLSQTEISALMRDVLVATSPATTAGSRRCSTAWIRSSSVSRGSTGTASWRDARARCRRPRRRGGR